MENKRDNLSRRTIKGLKWAYLSAMSNTFLNLIIISVLAHLLTPSDFGVIAIALIFIDLSKKISEIGTGPALIQLKKVNDKHISTAFSISIISGFFMMITLWILAGEISLFFNTPELKDILRFISLTLVIGAFGVPSRALLRKGLKFDKLMYSNIISYSIGYGFFGIILALSGFGKWALVSAVIIYRLLFSILNFNFSRFPVRLHFFRKELMEILKLGGGFTLGKLLNLTTQQVDKFIVGKMMGAKVLGIYTRAFQMAKYPTNYISDTLGTVLFPAFSEIQKDKRRLADIYLRGNEILVLFSLISSVILFIGSGEVVGILLGKQWGKAVPLLQILSFTIVFKVTVTFSHSLIKALGFVYKRVILQFIYLFVLISSISVGMKWGEKGVAYAVLFSFFMSFVLFVGLSLKILGKSFLEYLKSLYNPFMNFLLFLSLFIPSELLLKAISSSVWINFLGLMIIGFSSILLMMFLIPKKFVGEGMVWVSQKFDLKKFAIIRRLFHKYLL